MILRHAQLVALYRARYAPMHQPLAQRLRRIMPERVAQYDDAALLNFIADAHIAAERYAITSDDAVAKFVGMAALSGADFHTRPEAQQYLWLTDVDGDEKVRLLTANLKQDSAKNGA